MSKLIEASRWGHVEIVRELIATRKSKPGHVNNDGDVEIVRLITRHMLLERLKARRYTLFKVLRIWQQCVDTGKPGSNVFFFNMGRAMGQVCTFEELKCDYPLCSRQNHLFYLEGVSN